MDDGNQRSLQAHGIVRDPIRDFSGPARAIAQRTGADEPAADVRVTWGPESRSAVQRHGAVAMTIGSVIVADTDRWPPGTPHGDWVLAHEIEHTIEQQGRDPQLALLTEAEFRRQLGARPEQAVVIDALFLNPSFRLLWDYLGSCGALPAQDQGPVRLLVTPGLGLKSGGVERFGGYQPGPRILEVNPTKEEHVRNPQELVDTIVHEVIHAVFDLESVCVAAGSPPAPLRGAATVPPTSGGLPPLSPTLPGPGASNPCGESIDINVQAQEIITGIIQETSRSTRIGVPTLTFLNDLVRSDPAAEAAYDTCRRPACALANPLMRQAAISRCSLDVIGTFVTGDQLPSRVLFDFDSRLIRSDAETALDITAIFMRTHSTTHVILEGHADPTGPAAYNERLAKQRAESVARFLIAHGVPASQIDAVTSAGERQPISAAPAEHFQDRRVELIFSSVGP